MAGSGLVSVGVVHPVHGVLRQVRPTLDVAACLADLVCRRISMIVTMSTSSSFRIVPAVCLLSSYSRRSSMPTSARIDLLELLPVLSRVQRLAVGPGEDRAIFWAPS
jgi:hypothetical protein